MSKEYVSPTGKPILGTLEKLTARAEITGINDDGTPEYEGDTEVFWDSQETAELDGKVIFLDEDGYEWTFDQLKPVEESEDEPDAAPKPVIDPAQLADANGGTWGEHHTYIPADWRTEVENGDTRLGYWEWVASKIEAES